MSWRPRSAHEMLVALGNLALRSSWNAAASKAETLPASLKSARSEWTTEAVAAIFGGCGGRCDAGSGGRGGDKPGQGSPGVGGGLKVAGATAMTFQFALSATVVAPAQQKKPHSQLYAGDHCMSPPPSQRGSAAASSAAI